MILLSARKAYAVWGSQQVISLLPYIEAFWMALIFDEVLNWLVRKSEVSFSMDTFVKRLQPDIYELWKAGKDVGPHPCGNKVGAAIQPLRKVRKNGSKSKRKRSGTESSGCVFSEID